ncbi:MAG: 5-methyltetrahydropteroyltriglutamate--homocysteine methyltransferase [Verrucomicrobia bacterium]|nr:5-methyltetrahydropteroyltriglutamate--homocysteine methyltransferase [Verrucomicrobiota bacterium]MBI3868548.1 5-methyltetrahydropteroyltriglutamate--homocysteine methyltransferase [Verrucomicrobiota bacterium]
MNPQSGHPHRPDTSFDGGDLDCGGGLLLLIRRHIDPLPRGGLLEILSTDASVEGDLPSWCRLTGNELVSWIKSGRQSAYLVCKGALSERSVAPSVSSPVDPRSPIRPVLIPDRFPPPSPCPAIEPLSVLGIGSWPRPRWMIQAVHEHLEGRLSEKDFQATADDAVRLAVEAQLRAGVDVLTDGEQRRDSYASFVGSRLDNCQLIPLTDLTAMVDDREKFQKELRALDIPAAEVRHPVVFGRLGRSRPLAVHEAVFLRSLTATPIKIALPGPYLLTRTMWLDCLRERPYETREDLARDVVRVLREELRFLLAEGVSLVQFDEPVLTEVVFSGGHQKRSFMCGALSEKKSPEHELAFAAELLNELIAGLPAERIALHTCRGNWTRDEAAALTGGYQPLLSFLKSVKVGVLFLELCTPRAGEMEILRDLPERLRMGVGVVNQKRERVETVDEIVAKARRAIAMFGRERVLLTPDCGFATFADNPVASAAIAEAKLETIARARSVLLNNG